MREAHGAGGTPLIAALFWGHREVADLLGRHAVVPDNLRAAAGLGIPELVEACFTQRTARSLRKPAPREASIVRIAGSPIGSRPPIRRRFSTRLCVGVQEQPRERFGAPCSSRRAAGCRSVSRDSADLGGSRQPYGSAHWLLDHGAGVDQKATFGGLTHGQGITALHMAAQYGHMPVVKLLVDVARICQLTDDLYHAIPEGSASLLWAARSAGTTCSRFVCRPALGHPPSSTQP